MSLLKVFDNTFEMRYKVWNKNDSRAVLKFGFEIRISAFQQFQTENWVETEPVIPYLYQNLAYIGVALPITDHSFADRRVKWKRRIVLVELLQ